MNVYNIFQKCFFVGFSEVSCLKTGLDRFMNTDLLTFRNKQVDEHILFEQANSFAICEYLNHPTSPIFRIVFINSSLCMIYFLFIEQLYFIARLLLIEHYRFLQFSVYMQSLNLRAVNFLSMIINIRPSERYNYKKINFICFSCTYYSNFTFSVQKIFKEGL